jgi:hypothetical protein
VLSRFNDDSHAAGQGCPATRIGHHIHLTRDNQQCAVMCTGGRENLSSRHKLMVAADLRTSVDRLTPTEATLSRRSITCFSEYSNTSHNLYAKTRSHPQ